jgi:hypothetical protein
MFMEIEKPGPPPMAEGAYWLLTPIAIALATPPLINLCASVFDQPLGPRFATSLDLCRAPLVMVTQSILSIAARAVELLPSHWAQTALRMLGTQTDVALLSFAGGAYAASWIAAGLQRAWGFIAGAIAALALTLILGLSLVGLATYLIVALFFLDAWPLAALFDVDAPNDWAIAVPLVVPPALAVLVVAANALF